MFTCGKDYEDAWTALTLSHTRTYGNASDMQAQAV